MRAALIFVLFLSTVLSQTLVSRITIDDFSEGFDSLAYTLLTTVNAGSTPPVNVTSHYDSFNLQNTHLLGGIRSLILSMETGVPGYTFSALVNQNGGVNSLKIEAATGQNPYATDVQATLFANYDSSNSTAINPAGFTAVTGKSTGIDLTESGLGIAFHYQVTVDLGTKITTTVYSPNGNACKSLTVVPAGQTKANIISYFSNFTGTCDFSNVGAVQISDVVYDSVNVVFYSFTTYGYSTPPTPSATPTQSITSSKSVTPSLGTSSTPTASRSPGASPSPSPSAAASVATANCYCQCPAFTCELIFDIDDDGQNQNAYFFVDDDGFGNSHHYFGHYGYYVGKGNRNSASGLLISGVSMLLVIVVTFF